MLRFRTKLYLKHKHTVTSLCHNLLKALRGRKSGTWAVNDTETLKLGEKLALQKIVSMFNHENNEVKKQEAQMALLQPSEPSRFTGASRVRSLETLDNFLVSLKQRAQAILLMFDHLLHPNYFQTTPFITDLHPLEI